MKVSSSLREINQIMNGTMGLYHDIFAWLGMSDSVAQILYTVCASEEKCYLSEIARVNGMSKQTVNSAIRKLEGEGLVRLEAGKGRNRYVRLTEAGEAYARARIQPVMRAEEEVLSRWSERELECYLELARKYYREFEEKMRSMIGGEEE